MKSMFKKLQPIRAESILEYCYQANAVPFVWKSDTPGQVTLLKTHWRRFMVRSSQFITFANIPFLMIGLAANWKTYVENAKYIELTIHSLWFVFYCGCISMQILYSSSEKDVCNVVNEIYKFVAAMEKHFKSPEFERKRRLQDWFVSGAAFYLVGGSLFEVAMFLIFNKQSWYFLFPLPFDMKVEASRRIWPLVIFTLIELWFEITQWVSFIVITYINALFLLNVGTSLGLLLNNVERYKERLSISQINTIHITYCKIYLIQSAYNICLGDHFWPFFNAANSVCLIGTFSAFIITLGWGVPFITIFVGSFVVVALSITSITLQFTGGIHHVSRTLITAIGTKQLCKDGRKIHKCMQICAIRISSFFLVERKTVLTCMGVVFNSVATILLSGKRGHMQT